MKKFADKLASMKNEENEEGFTLIELVIVVAIIGILTAIAIPAYGAIQDTARTNSVNAAASDAYTAGLALAAQGKDVTDASTAAKTAGNDGEIVVDVVANGTDDVYVEAFMEGDGVNGYDNAKFKASEGTAPTP